MKKVLENKEKQTIQASNILAFIAMILCIVFIIAFIVFFSKNIFAISQVSASENNFDKIDLNETEENLEVFNLEEILKNNSNSKIEKELIVEKVVLEYTTIYRQNSSLPQGYMQVLQEGRDGEEEHIIVRTYENQELKEEKEKVNLLKASINKIVEIGTLSKKYNANAQVGDKMYVTSETLSLKNMPDNSAEKICMIYKNSEVELIEKQDNWYKINYDNYIGFVDKDCLTLKNPNTSNSTEESKENLIAKLNFDMDLNEPSGLSLEQFKSIFEEENNDKNNVFSENAEYFYYAEKQYNINGIFLAAVAIHESGWGTSKLAQEKNNLFGYGASDSNPFENAYSFDTYSECIDLLARVFVKYYINENGTSIYGGEVANGKYYNGSNLSGVNVKYASDKNWANSVYKWMKYLYNKI